MSGNDYRIDLFRPDDAPGVAQLFREVYGDEYPVRIVYNPEELVVAFENKEYIPILARTKDNRIAGFISFYCSAPYKGLYELGQALVLPDCRKTSIASLLFQYAVTIAPLIHGIDAIFGEAVCNHVYTQKAGAMFKYIETAMEIDLMPAEAYEKEKSASGRVSTLNMFRTIVKKPHAVYVPQIYADYCRYVYDGFDDNRAMDISTARLTSSGTSTEIETRVFDFAQVARVTVHEAGADFGTALDAEERRINDKNCVVIQVWLKLSWPWIGDAVNVLKSKGFFLGGVLPRWFGEDGFMMQKLLSQPNWEGINLYSERSRQILRFTKEDWQKTSAGQ